MPATTNLRTSRRPAGGTEAAADGVGADGVAEIEEQADREHGQAEQKHLVADLDSAGAAGGELGEEGEEEQRGLRVQQVYQDAVPEDAAEGSHLDSAGAVRLGRAEGAHTEYGEVGRASQGDHGEDHW